MLMLVLLVLVLLGAELTSSFSPSQDPEPDSRQDFIFAYYNGGQMGRWADGIWH